MASVGDLPDEDGSVLLPVEYGVREAGRQEAVDATTATNQRAGLETVEGQGA